ncbi:hypothetical protein BDY19DRAFT_997441 [Irpex rosettiformis]|uniref:Uncharacterized protein n=1 Tax=Irpex rosettiformis TaxID=378272 RepID=A0ACB8TRS0_9APHY|nr:hypothetical protein BDY19DRAFT_997441 [Irpex rosettiformis]
MDLLPLELIYHIVDLDDTDDNELVNTACLVCKTWLHAMQRFRWATLSTPCQPTHIDYAHLLRKLKSAPAKAQQVTHWKIVSPYFPILATVDHEVFSTFLPLLPSCHTLTIANCTWNTHPNIFRYAQTPPSSRHWKRIAIVDVVTFDGNPLSAIQPFSSSITSVELSRVHLRASPKLGRHHLSSTIPIVDAKTVILNLSI